MDETLVFYLVSLRSTSAARESLGERIYRMRHSPQYLLGQRDKKGTIRVARTAPQLAERMVSCLYRYYRNIVLLYYDPPHLFN